LELSGVMPLFNLGTLISVLIAVLFLGELFSYVKGIGIMLIVAGTICIEHTQGPISVAFKDRRQLYPFVPVVLFSIMHVANKKILGTVDPISFFVVTSFLYLAFFYFLSFFFYHHIAHDLHESYNKDKKNLVGVTAASIVSDFTYYIALALAPLSLVLPITRLHSLITVIFGGKYFHEHHLRLRMISTVIILLGLYFILV